VIIPKGSKVLVTIRNTGLNKRLFISKLQELFDIIKIIYPKVKVTKDLNKIDVVDSMTKKASTFFNRGDAAFHLVDTYNISPKQANTVLDKGGAILVKMASPFIDTPQQEQGFDYEEPAANISTIQEPLKVNNEVIESTIDMEDSDLMDTGMLASLIDNDDIKGILVDHLPSFLDALTNIGRTILITCLHKKELVKYFGTEQYTVFQNKLRRVFTSLGTATFGLKKYIKMA
jgi:hypothetical protein